MSFEENSVRTKFQKFKSKVTKSFWTVIAVIVIITVLGGVVGTIDAGERGVRLRFGAVTGDIIGEGLYFKLPIAESVAVLDVKVQKVEVEATAASKDLQTVHSVLALNYHLNPKRVDKLYQNVGKRYHDRIISPAFQEAVKASTAKFTAEELVTKRPDVRDEIKSILKEKLEPHDILVDEFNIVDFNFSDSFNEAIEAKVTAEQSALAAKNKLEQIKFEAEQAIEEARGKAEAIRVESEALKESRIVLQLRAVEKWNGIMPLVVGGDGVMPFLSIPQG